MQTNSLTHSIPGQAIKTPTIPPKAQLDPHHQQSRHLLHVSFLSTALTSKTSSGRPPQKGHAVRRQSASAASPTQRPRQTIHRPTPRQAHGHAVHHTSTWRTWSSPASAKNTAYAKAAERLRISSMQASLKKLRSSPPYGKPRSLVPNSGYGRPISRYANKRHFMEQLTRMEEKFGTPTNDPMTCSANRPIRRRSAAEESKRGIPTGPTFNGFSSH